MDNLPAELALATGLVSATVVVHLLGLEVLQNLIRWHLERFTTWVRLDRLVIPLGIVLGLFALHGLEIWIYALVYWRLDLLQSLEEALYFSTSAYSTLGETGAILPIPWRVVGVLEGINGMILIGWSTAFLFQILEHLMWSEAEDHPLPKGAIAKAPPRLSSKGEGAD